MKIVYDSKADAAYVYLKDSVKTGEVKQTITLNENLIVDLDKNGKLLGLEVLDAAANLTKDAIKAFSQQKKPTVQSI